MEHISDLTVMEYSESVTLCLTSIGNRLSGLDIKENKKCSSPEPTLTFLSSKLSLPTVPAYVVVGGMILTCRDKSKEAVDCPSF